MRTGDEVAVTAVLADPVGRLTPAEAPTLPHGFVSHRVGRVSPDSMERR
jgi:hypothetical protein